MTTSIIDICYDAIAHCRWKKILKNVLESEFILSDYAGKTFEEIFTAVIDVCDKVKGIGLLTMYDITASICYHHHVTIDKVFIIGGGPKRAIQLLNLQNKTKKIKIAKHTLIYAEPADIISAFIENGHIIDEDLKTSTNGDDFETFICIWQKTR